MKATTTATKLMSLVKGSMFVALAVVSFSASAMYVGNPVRPHTIWVPAHCENGCWAEGHYLKFYNPPVDEDRLCWVDGAYDANGNWIGGHYIIRGYNG